MLTRCVSPPVHHPSHHHPHPAPRGVFWSLATAIIYYTWVLYYSFVLRNTALRRIHTIELPSSYPFLCYTKLYYLLSVYRRHPHDVIPVSYSSSGIPLPSHTSYILGAIAFVPAFLHSTQSFSFKRVQRRVLATCIPHVTQPHPFFGLYCYA
ncbi:hypothetical protein IW261DRAFT_565730 [Armillaria novae-zelandiae]|uniref:Uncharacterized protein n=1 Tax=Armillaria novae-zelandiae TaxID=153914 RepID=A0AA39TZC3_9AGAR|nr:hypothetical protein IW261DRAFT_565730 [Armillaria novae-zelandiae]